MQEMPDLDDFERKAKEGEKRSGVHAPMSISYGDVLRLIARARDAERLECELADLRLTLNARDSELEERNV